MLFCLRQAYILKYNNNCLYLHIYLPFLMLFFLWIVFTYCHFLLGQKIWSIISHSKGLVEMNLFYLKIFFDFIFKGHFCWIENYGFTCPFFFTVKFCSLLGPPYFLMTNQHSIDPLTIPLHTIYCLLFLRFSFYLWLPNILWSGYTSAWYIYIYIFIFMPLYLSCWSILNLKWIWEVCVIISPR